MCWSGVRISDLNAFCDIPKDGDIVRIFNKKTSKEAIIPLFPEAKKIFEKYNHKVPRISGQKLNAGLKVLGEMIPGLNRNEQIQYNRGGKIIKETIPRYKLLCNHCGRRTLINTLINLGFEDRDIMVISGHTTMKSYEVYIKKKKGAAVKNILQQFNKMMELQSAANPLISVKETI
jgi:integrase